MASFSKIILVAALTLPVLASCGSSENTNSDAVQQQKDAKLNEATQVKLDQNTALINAVKDLQGLAAINPGVMQDPKKDVPKFVEYQKKQMLLSIAAKRMRTPEYLEIEKKRLAIMEYRDKWTKELKEADSKVQSLLSDPKNAGPSEELTKAVKARVELMKAFQATPEYQAHIQANQEKLSAVTKEMSKFTTPEMKKLQQEVIKLRKEVYGEGK